MRKKVEVFRMLVGYQQNRNPYEPMAIGLITPIVMEEGMQIEAAFGREAADTYVYNRVTSNLTRVPRETAPGQHIHDYMLRVLADYDRSNGFTTPDLFETHFETVVNVEEGVTTEWFEVYENCLKEVV